MHLFKKCSIRLFLFLGYAVLGGWLFCLMEKRNESYVTTGDRLLENLRKTMAVKYNLTNSTDFDDFVQAASEAVQTQNKEDWTFITGCAFTLAALTTVGYGDITPITAVGQGLTIPYCLIGLPLAMLALKSCGELLFLGLKTIAVNFEKKVLKRPNPRKTLMKCFTIIITCQFLLICIFAGVEVYLEEWTFLEGVYCMFVTFTTIGFGDYVPLRHYRQDNNNTPWKVYVAGLITFIPYITGLCLLSSLLSVLVQGSERIKVHLHKVYTCASCQQVNSQSEIDVRRETSRTKDNDQSVNENHGIKLDSFGKRNITESS